MSTERRVRGFRKGLRKESREEEKERKMVRIIYEELELEGGDRWTWSVICKAAQAIQDL